MTNSIISTTSTVNTPVVFYFTATTGMIQSQFTDFLLINNGNVVISPSFVIVEVTSGSGVYSITYTPLATGTYSIRVSGAIVAYFNITTRSVFSFLQNIEDEALGSWTWDKQAGTLTLLRQDGTALTSYIVTDSLITASRELNS